MKKYKIPENIREIIIEDDGVVSIIIKKLVKLQDEWKIFSERILLQEIK